MSLSDWRDFSKRLNKPPKSYVPNKLQISDKVWIRVDHVWRPLKGSCSGPYIVPQWTHKYFLIKTTDDINTQAAVGWLKPNTEKNASWLKQEVDAKIGQEYSQNYFSSKSFRGKT